LPPKFVRHYKTVRERYSNQRFRPGFRPEYRIANRSEPDRRPARRVRQAPQNDRQQLIAEPLPAMICSVLMPYTAAAAAHSVPLIGSG
jgi:hypothetical protein